MATVRPNLCDVCGIRPATQQHEEFGVVCAECAQEAPDDAVYVATECTRRDVDEDGLCYDTECKVHADQKPGIEGPSRGRVR